MLQLLHSVRSWEAFPCEVLYWKNVLFSRGFGAGWREALDPKFMEVSESAYAGVVVVFGVSRKVVRVRAGCGGVSEVMYLIFFSVIRRER